MKTTMLWGKCTGLQTIPDCNATESSLPCFYEHAWKETHACVIYKSYFPNTGGESVILNLNFDLEAGIDVIVKGPVHDITYWIGAQFYNTHTDNSPRFGIDVDWNFGYCLTHCLSGDADCDDPMPEIFVDERRVAEFQHLYRGNRMMFYGIGDGAQVLFLHTPNQP